MQSVESAANAAEQTVASGAKRPFIVFKSAGIVKQTESGSSSATAAGKPVESKTKNPEAIDIDLPIDDDDDDVDEDTEMPEEEDEEGQEAKVLEDLEDSSKSR